MKLQGLREVAEHFAFVLEAIRLGTPLSSRLPLDQVAHMERAGILKAMQAAVAR